MNPEQLRELASLLVRASGICECEGQDDEAAGANRAAAYLREQAERMEQEAVALAEVVGPIEFIDNHPCYGRVRWLLNPCPEGMQLFDAHAPAPQSVPEVDVLRAMQSAAVMPLIGPLLDAWDGMPNDFKGEMRDEVPGLTDALRKIGRAMMDGQAHAPVPQSAPADVVEALRNAALRARDFLDTPRMEADVALAGKYDEWRECINGLRNTIHSLDRAVLAEPERQPMTEAEYQRANPLGGPAALFDAIADRLRAGEPFGDVMRDYGITFAAADQKEPKCD